jgi:hypothetical protein
MRRDPVTPAVHAAVIMRDRACVLSFLERGHECRDIFGDPHRPDDVGRLTLEHVKSELRMGRRAESDLAHLVLLCGAANNRPPSKVQRALFREYLASRAAML